MMISFNQFNVAALWHASLSHFQAVVADVGVGLVKVFLELVSWFFALQRLN